MPAELCLNPEEHIFPLQKPPAGIFYIQFHIG